MRLSVAVLFLLCTLSLAGEIAPQQEAAQFAPPGTKLVGSGGKFSGQGNAVAISGDGTTAMVGGWLDNISIGTAWAWIKRGNAWMQQGGKLLGSGAVGSANQGTSVALSNDGNTAIVGGWLDNAGIGAAWVWTRTGDAWSQQGSKLVGIDFGSGTVHQGTAVALSADGNTAIVGGPGDTRNIGAAWVWTRTAGAWSQQGNKLVGSGSTGNSQQGNSVAMSADGNTVIIGAPGDTTAGGAAWVFVRSGGRWTQQGAKLVGSAAAGDAHQGSSVALSADGNTALVGGDRDSSDVGAVWVWTRTAGVWRQQGAKLVGTGFAGSPRQGSSVALAADGNVAFIGGEYDNGWAGAVWVWIRTGSTWTQQGAKVVGSGAVGAANQGRSVSVSADGKSLIIGAPGDRSTAGDLGASWIFSTPGISRRRTVRH